MSSLSSDESSETNQRPNIQTHTMKVVLSIDMRIQELVVNMLSMPRLPNDGRENLGISARNSVISTAAAAAAFFLPEPATDATAGMA